MVQKLNSFNLLGVANDMDRYVGAEPFVIGGKQLTSRFFLVQVAFLVQQCYKVRSMLQERTL